MHKKQSWMMALSQVAFTSFLSWSWNSTDMAWHSWLTYLVSCANRLPPVAISKLLFHMASSSSLRADCTSRSLTSPVRCWEWLTLTNYCSTNCCVAFSFAQLVVVLAGLNSFGLNVDLLILGPTEFVLRNPSHLQQPLPCSSAYPHSKQIWVLCHRCCIIGGWSSGSILAGLEETPTKAAELVFSKAVGTLLPKYICLWSWRQSNGMQRKCKDLRTWYRFLNHWFCSSDCRMQQATAAKAPQPSAPQKDEKQLLWLSLQIRCLNSSAMLLLLGVRTVARTLSSLQLSKGCGSRDIHLMLR